MRWRQVSSATYLTKSHPRPSTLGRGGDVIQSMARRCNIQRVALWLSFAPSTTQASKAWKIFLLHDVAVHRNLGPLTCSLVGKPTAGRSTSRRVVRPRSLPDWSKSGQTPITATGVAINDGEGPAPAAPMRASPNFAGPQMASATGFTVGFTARVPGVYTCLCRNFLFHTGTPTGCGDSLNPSWPTSPRYALRSRKCFFTDGESFRDYWKRHDVSGSYQARRDILVEPLEYLIKELKDTSIAGAVISMISPRGRTGTYCTEQGIRELRTKIECARIAADYNDIGDHAVKGY